jgi:hypothetical protein
VATTVVYTYDTSAEARRLMPAFRGYAPLGAWPGMRSPSTRSAALRQLHSCAVSWAPRPLPRRAPSALCSSSTRRRSSTAQSRWRCSQRRSHGGSSRTSAGSSCCTCSTRCFGATSGTGCRVATSRSRSCFDSLARPSPIARAASSVAAPPT